VEEVNEKKEMKKPIYLLECDKLLTQIDVVHKILAKEIGDKFAWYALKGSVEGYLEVKMKGKK
jgi:hypothetical protein